VTGEWRKLHNEEFHNLYSSPDIIRQINSRWMKWAEPVVCMGEERKLCKVLVGKPKGKRRLERPRHRLGGWDQNRSYGDCLGGGGGLDWTGPK
jgi:hypothetical protein